MEESEAGTCLRCGTAYPAGATVCFTCGAPIGETQTPTQPVRAIARSLPQARAAASATNAALPVAPGVAAPVYASTPARASVRPAAKARRGNSWLGSVLIAVLVLVLLGSSAYAIRALTAPAPVAHQTLYRDPAHHFHLLRPALWLATPTTDGVTLSDSDGASTAQISVRSLAHGETAASSANALAASRSLSAAPAQTIGGVAWEQRRGQATGTDGAVRQITLYVATHDGLLYTIELSSPLANYDATSTLVYQPLIASFAFD